MSRTPRLPAKNRTVRGNHTAVILYAIWALQFIVACLMEFVGLITVLFSGLAEGRPPHPNPIVIWYCALTFLLVVTIITEVCLFANERLLANTYLSLQIGKVVYISVVFGIYVPVYFKPGSGGDLGAVWTYVWQIGVYFGCWIPMLVHAIVVKWKEKSVVRREETPLLGSVEGE